MRIDGLKRRGLQPQAFKRFLEGVLSVTQLEQVRQGQINGYLELLA
jgi:hypothetical protein